VECVTCDLEAPTDPWAGLDPNLLGTPGGSAQAQYERKRQAREERIRSRHPKLGGLILVATDEPAWTTSWRTGAGGERKVGKRLNRLVARGRVEVLHDRAIPGSRANIDHIVVGSSGIFLVDTKRYKGSVERRRAGFLLAPGRSRLFVKGRDRTKLAAAVARQARVVDEALNRLGGAPGVKVIPVICFVDANWPLLQGTFRIGEVHVVWPRALEALVGRAGPIRANQRISLARQLAVLFPPL